MSLVIIDINYNCAQIVNITSFQNIPLYFTILFKSYKFVKKGQETCNLDITYNDREGSNNLEFSTLCIYIYIYI